MMEDPDFKFLALLRGINVGGKNIITKTELQQAFKDLGYSNVHTYIQSGNILFRSNEQDTEIITKNIEILFSDRFNFNARAVVYTEDQFKSIIADAPDYWGKDEKYRHRIFFPLGNVAPVDILKDMGSPKKEVETITPSSLVIYSSVSKNHVAKSVLRKFPLTPSYQRVTVRNQNTVFKIGKLFGNI